MTRRWIFPVMVGAVLAWCGWSRLNFTAVPPPPVGERAPAALQSQPLAALTVTPLSLVKVPRVPDREFSRFGARLRERQACLTTHSCPGPESDPKSYALALGKEQADDLKELRAAVEKAALKSGEITEIGLNAMQWPDGFVQAEALALLGTQTPTREVLEGVLAGLRASEDALLYPQAMSQFSRYSDPGDRERVLGFVMEALGRGASTVSAEISRHLTTLLTPENVGRFRALLAGLSPGTLRHRELTHALEEFDRR